MSRSAFFHPRNIAQLRPAITQQSAEVLVNAYVTSSLDYCNSTLSGIPNKRISEDHNMLQIHWPCNTIAYATALASSCLQNTFQSPAPGIQGPTQLYPFTSPTLH